MSSGVSEQMKVPGNTAKNVEEGNIPWSQQVDEASSFENLASNEDNSAANPSSMQFQFPPFNAKESKNISWNNYKSRKPSANSESNKNYGKPMPYGNFRKDDFPPNAWNMQHSVRKSMSDNAGNYKRVLRSEDAKSNNKTSAGISLEGKNPNAPIPSAAAAVKKTTWASIASQPAKLTSRATLTTSTHKKKGPGMPPPPMVPGKHDLDVSSWDVPNNNPPPLPSPPSPVDLTSTELSIEFNHGLALNDDFSSRGESRVYKGGVDFPKEEKPFNSNSNYGRVRHSPNGHAKKNWSYVGVQNRHMGSNSSGSMRRGAGGGGDAGGPPGRYNERKNNFGGGGSTRADHGIMPYDRSDESSLRSNQRSKSSTDELSSESRQAVLEELRDKNNYNPTEIDLVKAATARFFVIKSYSEDDIHRSIKYEIWCSTDHGNKRLDDAFQERRKEGGNILLFFSVNGSGHFCGMAEMMTSVDYNSTSSVWSQDKWKGKFKVKWIYVKDVPNAKLRHIHLENNDNKSVTHSRDTQEVPNAQGIEVLQILHSFKHTTSIFDDFYHYEKKQEEEVSSKKTYPQDSIASASQAPGSRYNHFSRQNDDRDRYRDKERDGGRGNSKFFDRNSSGGGGTNFRDRNRGTNYHNSFNDPRRMDSYRSATGGQTDFYHKRDRDTADIDKESTDYANRYTISQKSDYPRRDDRSQVKSNNWERVAPAKDMQKDNEHELMDRPRKSDY